MILTYVFYGHNLDKSIATDVGAGDVSGHWQAGTDSDPYPYQVWIPEAQTESMPLVLILHTRGEQGDDNNAQIITELASTWANNVEEPSILLAPQAPSGTGAWSVTDLDNIIYEIQSNYNIDLNRLYITGHSFGGRGVLNMLSGSDHKFAAATLFAPSGKGFDDLDTSTLGETPQWYVVSKSDVIVDDEAVYNYFLEVYASDSQ
ncbi:hypothetical protein [Pseudocolwellia sp. HL-MZ7]|uniref:carboxylesterase family protein n=1 Tax=Pseudocolwellia sp. HL-MZ7 TaxID=3400627 RepID=UPI003CE7E33B